MKQVYTAALALLPFISISQTWTQMSSMPVGKHHPVTFSIDGKGYAITGTRSLTTPTDDVFRYDPATNQWSEMNDFPGADRSFAIGQAYNGKGYLGFGFSTSSFLNDIWEYDPVADSWSLLTVCDCAGRRHPAFIIRDDKIYVGLGDGATGDLGDWHVYDMNTDTWTQEDNLPAPGRHHPFMFPAGDHVYVGMGHRGQIIFDDWYKFNIATDTWETMADFPGEARVAGTQFGHNDKGYVLSGDGDNHSWMAEGEFWEYDPMTDEWTQLPSHPGISRWAPGSFVINGEVYFMAGQNRQTGVITNDVWKFPLDPSTSNNEIIANASSVGLYPNPADEILHLDPSVRIAQISFYNLTGSLVYTIQNPGNTISVNDLDAGIYPTAITDEQGNTSNYRVVIR
jgi:N-acetylneuraminic acid mutarotase